MDLISQPLIQNIDIYTRYNQNPTFHAFRVAQVVAAAREIRRIVTVLNTTADKYAFINTHFTCIKKTVEFLLSFPPNYKFTRDSIKSQSLYGLGDSIQNNLSLKQYMRIVNKTDVFDAFVDGITHFASDTEVKSPKYRRDQSCGPRRGQSAFIDANMDCTSVVSDASEFERRKANVYNCYLERIMYNELFNHYEESRQDIQHETEAFVKIQLLFRHCFGADADIDVSFVYQHNLPTNMIVRFSSSRIRRTDEYERTLATYLGDGNNVSGFAYGQEVLCKQEIRNIHERKRFEFTKVQTFSTGLVPWTSVHEEDLQPDEYVTFSGGRRKSRAKRHMLKHRRSMP